MILECKSQAVDRKTTCQKEGAAAKDLSTFLKYVSANYGRMTLEKTKHGCALLSLKKFGRVKFNREER